MNRDLIRLSALTAILFTMLVGLGFWQLQRLAWKDGLVARIEARLNAVPVSLGGALAQHRQSADIDYLRVRLEGTFRHGKERHLFTVFRGKSGWRVVTPLETPSGHIVLVGRGFVPGVLKSPATRAQGQIPGNIGLTGLVRLPARRGYFTPENDVKKNVWYWRDLQSMAESVLSRAEMKRLVPFFVELEATPVPGGWPRGGVTRVVLPNRHLQYALTWFGLAGALLCVFAVYLWGRLRRRPFT